MKHLNSILSILFMLLTLAAAYGLDRWVSFQRSLASAALQPRAYLLSLLYSILLLGVIWFLLAWWVLARRGRWWAWLVFIASGLFALLYPFLRMTTGWVIFRQLRLPFIEPVDGHLAYTGAFVVMLGVLSWLLSGKKELPN